MEQESAASADPADLLNPPKLAEQLGVPEKTLAVWRSRGLGPKYLKVGRHARYRQSDVDTWLTAQER